MGPPLDLLYMMTVGAQAYVAGITITRHDAVGNVVEFRHHVMREESAGNELETLATF
ncbi:hypothetical protein D3C84_405320 [compost metagenome]